MAEGLKVERRLFHGLFATKDQKEGRGAVTSDSLPVLMWRNRYDGVCGQEETQLHTPMNPTQPSTHVASHRSRSSDHKELDLESKCGGISPGRLENRGSAIGLGIESSKKGQISVDPWCDGQLVQMFDPSRTRDVIQTASRRLISDASEVVTQTLNDDYRLSLLNRGLEFGNQDGLRRFDEDATVSLVSLTKRRRPGECVIWAHSRQKSHRPGAKQWLEYEREVAS